MSESALAVQSAPRRQGRPRALLVTSQDPGTRRYHTVGRLEQAEDGAFTFRYLPAAPEVSGFRPFLGFDDVDLVYTSDHLFPLFAERLLDDRRPDRISLLEALALDVDTEPLEFLGRSGGRRAGDRIELLEVPDHEPGPTSQLFFVHGVRHLDGASDAVDALRPGQTLDLEHEPDNPINRRAVLVTHDDRRLGWVPEPLLEYVRAVMEAGDHRVTVVRTNPRDLGSHLRLLVRLDGHLLG